MLTIIFVSYIFLNVCFTECETACRFQPLFQVKDSLHFISPVTLHLKGFYIIYSGKSCSIGHLHFLCKWAIMVWNAVLHIVIALFKR